MTICGVAEHSSWILIAKFSPKKVSPLEITLASLKKSKNCREIIAVKLFKNSPKKIELIIKGIESEPAKTRNNKAKFCTNIFLSFLLTRGYQLKHKTGCIR